MAPITSEFDLNPEAGLPDAIEEFAYYFDEPNADAGALPVWFLSKMTRQNVTVALSGEGADELFGGYLTYRADRLARMLRRLPAGVLRLALSGSRGWPVSDEKISFEYMLKRFLEGCQMAAARGARLLERNILRRGKAGAAGLGPARARSTAFWRNWRWPATTCRRIFGSIRNTICPTIF